MNPMDDFFNAINTYKPIHIMAAFSGGHDSLCATHYMYSVLKLKDIDIPFSVYHGDTGIGIAETQQFVKKVCEQYNWNLSIGSAGNSFEEYVKKYGYPGPAQHHIMYRNLKDKPMRHYVTHHLKSSPNAMENVLIITGIRSEESRIRMGYNESVRKEGSRIWTSPIMDWSKKEIDGYMKAHALPRNPVKDKICISGECLCGAFASMEERAEIKTAYPIDFQKISKLEKYSKWPWGYGGKTKWQKHNPPTQYKIPFMPMCVGCENKKT
jgi:3'-phosphoadenosine 5'-phosphosulfate sulfotransferase (PAPS reductase)/FAD synthetase